MAVERARPSNTDSNVVTISFTPAVSADFAIGAQLVTSPANGKINFSISTGSTTIAALGPNGQPGDVDDSSTLTQESYVPLGGAHLIAGTSYTLVGRVDAAGGPAATSPASTT